MFCPCAPYCGAESLVTLKLARALLDWGYGVRVIFQQKEASSVIQDSLNILPYCVGIKAGNGYVGALLWCVKAIYWAVKTNWKYDLVMSRAMPAYAHAPALVLKCVKKISWIANWSDPFPAGIAPSPYGKGVNAKISMLHSLYAKLITHKADWHTFPSSRLRDWISRRYPKIKSKSSIIPHIMFEVKKVNEKYKEHDQLLKLIYAGSLYKRNPEVLLEALAVLRNKNIEFPIKFFFIGEKTPSFEECIDKYYFQEYINCLGRKSYAETCLLIEEADVAVMLEAPCEEGVFLSSKLLDYLQYNKPIFAMSPTPGVMEDLLIEFGGGVFANCSAPEDVANKLCDLIALWKDKRMDTALDSSRLKKHFSLKNAKQAWQEVENKCVCNK